VNKTLKLCGILIFSACSSLSAAPNLSPAMSAVMEIQQESFRGYKPGNKEMRSKLAKLGKVAGADEVEQVMKGEKPDWAVLDIRSATQYNGGHIVVDGKPMKHVGRLQPTTEMQNQIMEIKDNKEIVNPAPDNVIIVCRSAMKTAFDYASYAVAGFNDVKIASVLDWAKACKPLASSSEIEDAALIPKKVVMKQHSDGLYYWDQCSVFN